ncbi:MAG TPA: NAD-dependent malic enzyme, partial [Chthoniobacterales bacterium]|nr:NAD-dependent malic enzyme [Chthoniobacterales bacterium]
TMKYSTKISLPVGLRGMLLLDTPLWNKGTAFNDDERGALGLCGLLPPQVESLQEQSVRAYEAFNTKTTDLGRHIYLRQVQDSNETLFYRLILDHIEEMLPIVYTPTVGLACQEFSHIYRRPRGLIVSRPLCDSIAEILRNRPNPDVDVIVVTDGERILGLGDQGVGGLGIPIGKLSLYSLIGGIHPSRTLPIALDVGTNNEERIKDPEYLGWRHERVRGQEYLDFVDHFVQAVKQELPNTCLQWEDFATPNARPLLLRYQNELLTFNDDVQGTAAVVLGAVVGASKVARKSIKEHQIVFVGAGSAAIGVADYLRDAMVEEGLSENEARARFWIVDKDGLLDSDRRDLSDEQKTYARARNEISDWPRNQHGQVGLAEVISKVDATVLIGLSTVKGIFTESIVREMARKTERPIIFPLSNPTSHSEAEPANLMAWTEGRALVATGSPFAPVKYGGKNIEIAQCNNVFIFPAVGLGLVVSQARRVTDKMMLAGAKALGDHSPALRDPAASLLPSVGDIRAIALEIAYAVALEAQKEGLAPACEPEALRREAVESQWTPEYLPY